MPPEPAGKAAPEKRCPVCGKPATADSHPFCSERCRDVDLNRWFSGVYSVPVVEDEDEDGEGPKRDGERE